MRCSLVLNWRVVSEAVLGVPRRPAWVPGCRGAGAAWPGEPLAVVFERGCAGRGVPSGGLKAERVGGSGADAANLLTKVPMGHCMPAPHRETSLSSLCSTRFHRHDLVMPASRSCPPHTFVPSHTLGISLFLSHSHTIHPLRWAPRSKPLFSSASPSHLASGARCLSPICPADAAALCTRFHRDMAYRSGED